MSGRCQRLPLPEAMPLVYEGDGLPAGRYSVMAFVTTLPAQTIVRAFTVVD